MRSFRFAAALLLAIVVTAALVHPALSATLVPSVLVSNVTVRVMAANITTGNNQRYEGPGLRIFQALRPDIVAVQEFNYASTNGAGISTPSAFREMIDSTFGPEFNYYRESGAGYTIPNGIISRWPIVASNTWDDVQVPDRGFAWALVDLPGPRDLHVVSVHLHSGGGASSRAIEATNLRTLIQSNLPPDAWIIVAGDLNTDTRGESAVTTLKTFLSDDAVPVDQRGVPGTNLSRQKPYDYVLPSFALAANQTATVVGTNRFPSGLVFDSRVPPLLFSTNVVFTNDSASPMMQHMAVVKDFSIPQTFTNLVPLEPPVLVLDSPTILRWQAPAGVWFTVQTNAVPGDWANASLTTSTTTNFAFTNTSPSGRQQFYRVIHP